MIKVNAPLILCILSIVTGILAMDGDLHQYAYSGNLVEVKRLIKLGANINAKDARSRTPLHWAAYEGNYQVVEELLQCPLILVNELDNQKDTPLSIAARHGYESIVEQLLIRKDIDPNMGNPLIHALNFSNRTIALKLIHHPDIDINRFSQYGYTPLYSAIREFILGHSTRELIDAMLQHPKIDINSTTSNGDTQLHRAIELFEPYVLKGLLNIPNMRVNVWNKNGDTPLHRAVSNHLLDAVQALVDHGAEINVLNPQQESPLYLAIENNDSKITLNLLSSPGIQVNIQNSNGDTPLHRIASKNTCFTDIEMQLLIVRRLMEAGAHVNIQNCDLDSPLHRAIEMNNTDIIFELLLNSFINVNSANKYGDTPLHRAVFHKNKEVVEKLIFLGAHINCQNKLGETPLHIATDRHDIAMVTFLASLPTIDINISDNNGNAPLHRAASCGFDNIVSILLAAHAHINAQNHDKDTPLHRAIEYRYTVSTAQLLLQDAAINVNVSNKYGDTPLHRAVYHNQMTLVDQLLQKGALINAKNCSLKTPCHVTFRTYIDGTAMATKLLKTPGIDAHAQDNDGNTILHLASRAWAIDVIRTILAIPGINPNIENNDQETPVSYVIKSQQAPLIEVFKKYFAKQAIRTLLAAKLERTGNHSPAHSLPPQNYRDLFELIVNTSSITDYAAVRQSTSRHPSFDNYFSWHDL